MSNSSVAMSLTQPSLNLASLASHKQIDALMLVAQNIVQRLLKVSRSFISSTGYRDGFAVTGCGILLDEILDLFVVNVVWRGVRKESDLAIATTYKPAMPVWSADAVSCQTSSSRVTTRLVPFQRG